MRKGEVDFRLDVLGSSHGVLLKDFPENAVAVRGVVEILDGLMQGLGRESRQLLLEGAEGNGALIEVLGSLRSLQADAALNEVVNPPVAVFALVVPGLPIHRGNQGQRPVGVGDLRMEVLGNGGDVLLEARHIRERPVGDFLQNVAAAGACDHQVGHINVAAAVALAGNRSAVQLKLA